MGDDGRRSSTSHASCAASCARSSAQNLGAGVGMSAITKMKALNFARRARNDARYLGGRLADALRPGCGGALKIFVVGSGRSGTHWLGFALGHHQAIHVEIEEPPTFGWIVQMARN